MKMKLFPFALFLIVLFNYKGMSQSCTRTASTGEWNNTATWGGTLPVSGDVICIPSGITVTIPQGVVIDLSSPNNTIVNLFGSLTWGGSGNDNSSLILSGGSSLNYNTGSTLTTASNGSHIYLQFNTTPTATTYNKAQIGALVPGTSYPSGSALPVELIKFEVKNKFGLNSLTWQTASELNNEKFIIERSSNGREYSAIGSVAGSGTTFQQVNYAFTDASPIRGQNYYRLRQMDFDGSSSLSPVRSVMVASGNATTVYPTITTNEFSVKTTADEIIEVHLFDAQGRMVEAVQNIHSQSTNIDLSSLPKGGYFVVVKTSEGLSHHRMMHQ